MEETKTRARTKVVLAAASFIIGCLLLLFIGGYVQYRFGMLGLVITELMLLAVALLSTLIARMDFKKVFRVKASTGLEWLGSILVFFGAYFAQYGITYLLVYFFPESMTSTSGAINELVTSAGMIFAIIAVSILPGICEEAWHRGYLLSSLSPLIRSVSVRVIIMGIVFGLFHMDPTRFLQTMCLGFALSFVRIKTDNMLVPVSLHAFNNLFSVLMAFLLASVMQAIPAEMVTATEQSMQAGVTLATLIPILLMAASLSAVFITLGRYVFGVVERKRQAVVSASTAGSAVSEVPTPTLTLGSALPPASTLENWAPPSTQPIAVQQPPAEAPPSIVDNKRVYLTVSICGTVAILSFIACIASSFFAL